MTESPVQFVSMKSFMQVSSLSSGVDMSIIHSAFENLYYLISDAPNVARKLLGNSLNSSHRKLKLMAVLKNYEYSNLSFNLFTTGNSPRCHYFGYNSAILSKLLYSTVCTTLSQHHRVGCFHL